jgi:cellobiose-specific phosphotransferase system component IIC
VDFTGQLEGILSELLGESGVIVAVIVGLLVEAIYGLLLTLNLGLK